MYALFYGLTRDLDFNSLKKIELLLNYIENGEILLNILISSYTSEDLRGKLGIYRQMIIKSILSYYKDSIKIENINICNIYSNDYIPNDFILYVFLSLINHHYNKKYTIEYIKKYDKYDIK